MTESLISAKSADLKLGARQVLKNIDFDIKAGEIAIFIGPNGGGKTSLIKMLLGLFQPNKGKVWRKAGLKISYVPQKFELNSFLPLQVERLLNFTKTYSQDELEKALQEVNCGHLLNASVEGLSGGELQRILLARAMLSKPDILVLDEALQGVDQAGEVKLNNLISTFSKRNNTAIIMVSHDLHLVMKSTAIFVAMVNPNIFNIWKSLKTYSAPLPISLLFIPMSMTIRTQLTKNMASTHTK
jgi:zinc transport system ATP-binding protein